MGPQVKKYPDSTLSEIKLVVSDFHLGTGKWLSKGNLNPLEDFAFDSEFSEFLEHHRQGQYEAQPVELILNGDILNLLQVEDFGVHHHLHTERFVCRALKRIIDGHPVFFEALKDFAAAPQKRISYIVGNHDAGLLWVAPQQMLQERVEARVSFFPESYRFNGVHIEHGQQHEELARMDMERPFLTEGLPEPVLNLPWGSLFVAVVLSRIKMERPHVDKVRPVAQFLRYILLHDTLWAVGALIRIGWFFWVTVVFRSRYHLRSGFRASWRMFRELTVYPDFDGVAERLLRSDPSIHTVIFGHTHVLRDRKFEGGGRYLNEGSWNEATHLELSAFGTQIRLTYAQIEASDSRTEVRLKRWRGHWRPEADLVL